MILLGTIDPIVAGLGGAAVAALGAVVVQARRFSGKIETTEAKDLWEESRSIREVLRMRVGELTVEVERLEERINKVEQRNVGLNETITALRAEIAELKIKLTAADAKADVSGKEVERLTERLREEQANVNRLEGRAREKDRADAER